MSLYTDCDGTQNNENEGKNVQTQPKQPKAPPLPPFPTTASPPLPPRPPQPPQINVFADGHDDNMIKRDVDTFDIMADNMDITCSNMIPDGDNILMNDVNHDINIKDSPLLIGPNEPLIYDKPRISNPISNPFIPSVHQNDINFNNQQYCNITNINRNNVHRHPIRMDNVAVNVTSAKTETFWNNNNDRNYSHNEVADNSYQTYKCSYSPIHFATNHVKDRRYSPLSSSPLSNDITINNNINNMNNREQLQAVPQFNSNNSVLSTTNSINSCYSNYSNNSYNSYDSPQQTQFKSFQANHNNNYSNNCCNDCCVNYGYNVHSNINVHTHQSSNNVNNHNNYNYTSNFERIPSLPFPF